MLCKRCLLNLRLTCTLPGRSFDKTFTAKRLAKDKILLVTVWFEWHVSGRNNFLLKSNVTAHDSLHYVMPILNAMQFIDLSFSNDGVITRTYLNNKDALCSLLTVICLQTEKWKRRKNALSLQSASDALFSRPSHHWRCDCIKNPLVLGHACHDYKSYFYGVTLP